MRRLLAATAFLLVGCASVPPKNDPEGCDRIDDRAKRVGSDLVVDGDLHCATDDGDCVLTPSRIVTSKASERTGPNQIQIHVLRKEAEAHGKELSAQNAISLCYPPELWFPSEGHLRGRFYLRQEAGGRYHMAFYPRVTKEF